MTPPTARPSPAPVPSSRSPLEETAALRLRPRPEELEELRKAREELVAAAERTAKELRSPLRRALVAGSSARGTYLPAERGGRLDLDLFLLFDPSLPREELASRGLELAERLLTDPQKRYAEHPYLRGQFGRFAVDAVPGYLVDRSDRPMTAVDRTPFHHEYLLPKLTPALQDDVRLLKRFLRTLGIYGADARTAGASGYLVELLVLRSGSFAAFVREAARWRLPQRLCPPGPEPAVPEEVALVLPDPVDPHRNVASALSRRNLALLILGAREYLERPRPEFFDPPQLPSPSGTDLARRGAIRGSEVLLLRFPVPDLVDDILYPQLRKCERALRAPLERRGFLVLGTSSAQVGSQACVLVELDRPELGKVGSHRGPPADAKEVPGFLDRWEAELPEKLEGPYLTEEGRLQVDVRAEPRDALSLLRHELPQMGFGRSLQNEVRAHGTLSRWEGSPTPPPEVLEALRELWDRALPWARWGRKASSPTG